MVSPKMIKVRTPHDADPPSFRYSSQYINSLWNIFSGWERSGEKKVPECPLTAPRRSGETSLDPHGGRSQYSRPIPDFDSVTIHSD